ncbi:MAG: hypothetical protein KME32_12895 [Mojavia pulchra JT2-VF2]|uniref:Uncharacterized protein n=1 Tax=Mojavia pulchra JT2-VF2 TaxID=287848 RepID=A0A951PZP2_9NOST|nr:hypothetical protein [Mojavia pulchra JT2-VF2]
MNIGTQTVLTGALAGFALLTLAASPSLAETLSRTVTNNNSNKPASEVNQTQKQISQTTAPNSQMPQQPQQMGCSCCKNMMMNNTHQMNNMHQMMRDQTNQRK